VDTHTGQVTDSVPVVQAPSRASRLRTRLHLIRALSWVPVTLAVFLLHRENVVAITFVYSAYANLESGLATWQASKANAQS
jgi:hypothetical protein